MLFINPQSTIRNRLTRPAYAGGAELPTIYALLLVSFM
jgi:hypothetical protein